MWEEETSPSSEMGNRLGVLAILADFVEMYDIEVAVTLAVEGIFVSGVLIGTKAFVTELGRLLEHEGTHLPGEAGSEIRQALSAYADRQAAALMMQAPVGSTTESSHSHARALHLKHAQLLRSGDTVHLPLWECKLRHVSGFSLGQGNLV
jgi:hypothetical protein